MCDSIVNFEHGNTRVVALVWGDSRCHENIVEIEFGLSVLHVKHIEARMVPQVCVVVVTSHLNDYLLVVISEDLEVAICEVFVPELSAGVSHSRVDMARQDEFAASINLS